MIRMPYFRAPRRQTNVYAQLLARDEWAEIKISNLSTTGLMVKFPGGLARGTKVEIRRRGTVILGEVVWSTTTRLGIRSFNYIDQSALLDVGLLPKPPQKFIPARKGWWHWRNRN